MTIRSMKFAPAIAAVAAVSFALTGCAPAAEEPEAPQELTTIDIGVLPYANLAPIYIGIENGIFEEHGFEFVPRTFQSGSEEVTALVAGEIDVAFIGYFTGSVPISKGLPIQMFANNDHEGSTVDESWAAITIVAGDSDIQGVEDLVGRTVGVNALRSQAEVQNTASWAEQGVDVADVNLLEVPMPEMGAALANGSVDAVSVAEPFASAILAEGGRQIDAPLVTIAEEGTHFPNAGWAATTELLDDADLIERLAAALHEATDYTQAHPDETRAILPEFTSLTPEQADAVRLPYFNSSVDEAMLQVALDLAFESGLLEREVTIDELLAPTARKFI